MQVCTVNEEDSGVERRGLKTDESGRHLLCAFLRKEAVVALEVCGYANNLARLLAKQVGCEVHMLNPGGLVMVWKSRKKTDKEDALKIAKYLRDTPEAEWVEVPLLSEEEEGFRADITMKEFLKKERTMAVNRLHALYGNEGIIDVTRGDLKDEEGRKARHGELSPRSQGYARILEEQLVLLEQQLEALEAVLDEQTRNNELTPYVLSIPGVGIGIAAVLIAYLGDGKRFSKPGEAANYAGFAPRVDCAGDTNRYGSIARHRYCHPIRAVVLEGVWAISRCSYGGPLGAKFHALKGRMNKRKSAVAIARKLVTLAWLLMKRRECYSGIDSDALKKKLKYYKVRKWEPAA